VLSWVWHTAAMGEKGTGDKPEPTLELPSLRRSFRRKKRAAATAPQDASTSPEADAVAESVGEVAPRPAGPVVTGPVVSAPVVPEPTATDASAPGEAEAGPEESRPIAAGRRRDRNRNGPPLPALTAVVLTGLLVGLVGTGATFGGLQACEVARGTSSCGDPGFFVLVVIVIVMMLLGAVLLKTLQVPEAKGVSFLGVGLLCVIVLVGLVDALFSPWMFLVVPALTALTFAVGRWVTTRFVDQAEDEPGYDVR
jgi:hypothetical protein